MLSFFQFKGTEMDVHQQNQAITSLYNAVVVLNIFGTRDQFHERQFFLGLGGGVGGSIVCFISIIVTPAPPQMIRH